jgi:hypothetical protein
MRGRRKKKKPKSHAAVERRKVRSAEDQRRVKVRGLGRELLLILVVSLQQGKR